jgi:hypothetical protein
MSTSLTPRYLIVFLLIVLTTVFSIQVMQYDHAYLYGENQLMEHVQLLILLLVGIVFWLNSGENNWLMVKPASGSLSLLAYLGAALSFSFILREMSIKQSNIDWLIFFVDGQGFKIIMALVWIPLLKKAYHYRDEYIHIIKKAFLSPTSILLAIAASLLLAGGLFDKEIIIVEYFRFYEEALEMNGYGLMLLAALSFRYDMIKAVCNSEKEIIQALQDSNELAMVHRVGAHGRAYLEESTGNESISKPS